MDCAIYTNDVVLKDAGYASTLLMDDFNRLEYGFSFVYPLNDQIINIATIHRGFLSNGNILPYPIRQLVKKWIGLDSAPVVVLDWLSEYKVVETELMYRRAFIYDIFIGFKRAIDLTNLSNIKKSFLCLCVFTILHLKRKQLGKVDAYKRCLEDQGFTRCD